MLHIRSMWTSAAGRMKLVFGSFCLVSLVYCGVAYNTISAEKVTVETVGHDASESVFLGGQIKMTAAKAGTAAASAFQTGQAPTEPEPGKAYCDPSRSLAFIPAQERSFYESSCQLHELIGRAFENVTYKTDVTLASGHVTNEQTALNQISLALTNYNRLIERAFANRNMLNPVDLSYLRAATEQMTALETAAQDLIDVNDEALSKQFASRQTSSKVHLVALIGCGVLLLGMLWYLNNYTKKLFRRQINGPIALAAVGILAMTVYVSYSLMAVDARITSAKNDAYVSEFHTYSTLADALMMETHQTMSLLQSGGDPNAMKRFDRALSRISTGSVEELENLPRVIGQNKLDLVEPINVKWQGALAEELRAITFKGERRAALDAVQGLGAYVRINAKVRQLVQDGQQAAAIALATGTGPGQGRAAAMQLESSLQTVLDINHTQFVASVTSARQSVRWTYPIALVMTLICAGLTFGGLRSGLVLLRL